MKTYIYICVALFLCLLNYLSTYQPPLPLPSLERNTSEGNVRLHLFYGGGAPVSVFAYVYIFQNLSSECELISWLK